MWIFSALHRISGPREWCLRLEQLWKPQCRKTWISCVHTGLLNYYGRFIHNFSPLLKTLHELLTQGRKWEWSEACQMAFVKSENPLWPIIAMSVTVVCVTSPYWVGAVVLHIILSGTDKPIAFASRTLNTAESNYAQIQLEVLSIVFGTSISIFFGRGDWHSQLIINH